jgi:hypothetical protein
MLSLSLWAFCTAAYPQAPADSAIAAETAATDPAAEEADSPETDTPPPDAAMDGATEIAPEEGPGALVEEDSAIAASAEEEFDPDEEISEDYPVPLPSDI